MKHVLIILFTISFIQVNAQKFVQHKDSVNRFSIFIPAEWKYTGEEKQWPGIIFSATRVPVGKTDRARDNFNINVINTPKKDLEKTFSDFLKYLPGGIANYKLIEKGDITLNGRKFKWLVETHDSGLKDTTEVNYDFVTVRGGKTYILTMVTYSYHYDIIKPVFDKIAGSFILED